MYVKGGGVDVVNILWGKFINNATLNIFFITLSPRGQYPNWEGASFKGRGCQFESGLTIAGYVQLFFWHFFFCFCCHEEKSEKAIKRGYYTVLYSVERFLLLKILREISFLIYYK